MFNPAIQSSTRIAGSRLALFGLAVAVLSAATLQPAAADTYLSAWKNKTSCDFDVKGNGPFTLLPGGQSVDLGPTPRKDPPYVLVVPSAAGCAASLKQAKLAHAGSFPGKKCGGIDPGPFKLTVDNDGRRGEICYCVNALRVGYLNVEVEDQAVTVRRGANTYECGD
jgi:hypothetical protein